MQYIKRLLKFITDIGIDDNYPLTDKFRIRFVNGLHFLIAIILLIGITHWVVLDKRPFTYIELFCLSLSLIGLLLNKIKRYNASMVLFYLYCNFLVVYNIEFYPDEIAGYVYYFPFAMVLGINNLSVIRSKWSYIWLFVSFVIFVVVIFFDISHWLPSSWIVSFTDAEIEWVRNFNIAIAGLCVVFFTYFYMWLSDLQTREIKMYVDKEKKLQQQLLHSLNQKDILLSEVHHRVKNNLAILNSIVNMKINNHSKDTVESILLSLQNRIYNMGLIHHLLYTHENIDNISVHEFAKQVIHSTLKHYDFNGVSIVENFDDIGNIKAGALIPYGIILNEIVSNAIMYAFTHHSNPSLNINMYQHSDEIVLHIKDNGWGIQSPNTEGLGIELIKMLTEQINGKVEFYNDNGLNVKVIVPVHELADSISK